jgi:hypothetical protein
MVSEGDVYYDNVFDSELKVVEIDGKELVIDDSVGGDSTRSYRKWELEHNINVGRFEKIREESTEKSQSKEQGKQGIFDY